MRHLDCTGVQVNSARGKVTKATISGCDVPAVAASYQREELAALLESEHKKHGLILLKETNLALADAVLRYLREERRRMPPW